MLSESATLAPHESLLQHLHPNCCPSCDCLPAMLVLQASSPWQKTPMWCWTWTLHNFHPWPWPYPSMPPGMSLISASQGGAFKWLPYLLFHRLFFQVTPESSALLLLSWSSDNLDLLATLFGMSVSVRGWGFPTARATFPSALSSWDYT